MEISEIITRLLGDISVECETYHDDEVLKNLDGYEEALSAILKEIFACAHWKGDYRGSANACGKKAQMIVIDSIMKSIDDTTALELSKALTESCPESKEKKDGADGQRYRRCGSESSERVNQSQERQALEPKKAH